MVAYTETPRVMIVDDEELFREMVCDVLGEHFEVVPAENAEQALRIFRDKPTEAVLMDLMMPGRGGMDGIRAIRSLDPDVSLIVITGFGQLDTAKAAMSLGVESYIEKPVKPADILRAVRRGVDRTVMMKRRTRSMQEMADMIRGMSQDLKKLKGAQNQAALSSLLLYDLLFPLTRSQERMEEMRRDMAEAGSGGSSGNMARMLTCAEQNIQQCRAMLLVAARRVKANQEVQAFPIEQSLAPAIEKARELAASLAVPLDARIRNRQAIVAGDCASLQGVLEVILTRAIEESGDAQSAVRVACQMIDAALEIRIEDRGRGHDMDRLRVCLAGCADAQAAEKGYGIGLGVVSQVVEQHGGRLSVQSAPGRGTVVTVRLPVHG